MNKPSINEIEKYLKKWYSLENYVLQESSLKKLFTKTYPLNINIDDVLIKVCALNDFYSTSIYHVFIVAKHIVNLNIDQRLKDEDISLVNEIAKIKIKEHKYINYYSFATKYCSHHYPTIYPIYDSYVEKMLWYFMKADNFSQFGRGDLKDYPRYRNILLEFRTFYGLEKYNLKEIDKYLWQAGNEYFPRKF